VAVNAARFYDLIIGRYLNINIYNQMEILNENSSNIKSYWDIIGFKALVANDILEAFYIEIFLLVMDYVC